MFLWPEIGRPIIQRTGRTSFSVIKFSPRYYPCEVSRVTFHQEGFSIDEGPAGAATVRNELPTCPRLGVTVASVPRRLRTTQVEEVCNCYSRREGGHDRLVGDWTVPDQFGFTFRVELRMTVIDRHQGHTPGFSTVFIDNCSFVFFFFSRSMRIWSHLLNIIILPDCEFLRIFF